MNKYISISTLQFLLLFLLAAMRPEAACAQENAATEAYQQEELASPPKLDKSKWEKLSKEYDYSKEKTEKEKDEKTKPIKSDADKPETPKMSPYMQNILKYSLFGVVIVVLAFIVFKLIAGGSVFNNKKIEKDKVYTVDDIEENLHEVDVEVFLKEAMSSQNYRLAVRLYYLNILKSLSLAGKIEWKREKTNGAYLREMSQHPQIEAFRQVTYIYEYVWFNEEANFSSIDFETVRPFFRNLLTLIDKQGSVAIETPIAQL